MRDTNEHRGMSEDPSARRARIAVKAREDTKCRFNNLLHHMTIDLVREGLQEIPLNSAVGVDGMSVEMARAHCQWLVKPILQQIHQGIYDPPPVRRVYIPKVDGRKRPIGVPTAIERGLQKAVTTILNEIYEQDFLSCSFGFRPGLSCHHALATIESHVNRDKTYFALEVDIRDFFGTLDHGWLEAFLGHRISDTRVLKLIKSWLKAGVLEQGKWEPGETGTIQGGSISPLLANVYLHYVLDLWWEKVVKMSLKGKAHLVRYCDDFVILFQNREEADNVLQLIKARLAQFGLRVAEEKTHVTDLRLCGQKERKPGDRKSMTFLGFSMFLRKRRRGDGVRLLWRTENKRFSRAKAKIKEAMKRFMHADLATQAHNINRFLRGHFNYYGMPGNIEKIAALHYLVNRHWRRILSRRSQKGRVPWAKMNDILKDYPLYRPRLKITYRDLNAYVRL